MKHEFDIAILLPTRGRAEMLERSVQSLITLAKDQDRVQLMFGFDNDDDVGLNHFKESVQRCKVVGILERRCRDGISRLG